MRRLVDEAAGGLAAQPACEPAGAAPMEVDGASSQLEGGEGLEQAGVEERYASVHSTLHYLVAEARSEEVGDLLRSPCFGGVCAQPPRKQPRAQAARSPAAPRCPAGSRRR